MEIKDRYEIETVSHSGLSSLEVGPVAYRAYKARENSASAGMNLGTAAHCVILEPDEFTNRYLVSKFEIPTGKNAVFVEELFRTRVQDDILTDEIQEEWIDNAWKVSGLKSTALKTWESFTSDTDKGKDLQRYWDYLLEAEGKLQLSNSDMETINRCKLSTDIHKKAQELLYGYGLSDTFVELDIVWKHPQFKFKMRSIIDRLIVDESTKTIIVVDLKTTAKNVHKFLRAYEMYGYYKQLALYRQAAIWYAKEVLELDISDWTFEEYIVAVQTTGYNECVVYKPSADDLKQGSTETLVALKRMEWHFDNDKWDFPKEYYEGDGVITLNLNEE